jgi:hypothetical protein
MPTSLFPVLLVIHIALAIALILPSIVLPFALRAGRAGAQAAEPGPVLRALLWLQAHGSVVIGLGLAITGTGLILSLGTQMLAQPWLLVALAIYAGNLVLAFFVQRPNLRRLVGGSSGDEASWRRRARRQRYVSYAMAGLVGAIGFLMRTKPVLW